MPPTEIYTAHLSPSDFVDTVDNPYFPLIPGTKMVYEGQTEDGLERIEIVVLSETRKVIGINATVLNDTVYLNGEMIENTYDWYAQDKEGNVWYLGEGMSNYENGEIADKAGSWEAGVDGAQPGIIMFANPSAHIGETYRQEYYQGVAEDMADLLSVEETVSIPYDTFSNVVKTKDYTPLEPELLEEKYYSAGIGLVMEVDPNMGEKVLLVEFIQPER